MTILVGLVRAAHREARGQSLVETALALPLLLLVVIGVVDVGRVYALKTQITNAAREAAAYAARDPQATANAICGRALAELNGAPEACSLDASDASGKSWIASRTPATVTCARGTPETACGSSTDPLVLFQTPGAAGADVTVTVTYRFSLLTGYLVGRAFAVNPVSVGAAATFTGLGQ